MTLGHVVLVVSVDSDRSDWLKTALIDSYIVTVVSGRSEVLQKLSADTDVVLVDTVSKAEIVPILTQVREENEYEFQVGVLTTSEQAEPWDVGAVLPWSLSAEDVHESVEWLMARARYCQTLSNYYQVTVALADQQMGACKKEDRTELRARRERLETRLNEIADTLDSQALYDAVLY